jgi:anaphase-promoting complex subunit 1
LKVLRWRYDEGVNYGSHLAYGTAIGLLFLGGGTCTLGREPEDIAALVMAFYPRYPTTTSDNQYHLQALRNLYAIAVKDCELRAIDVDTGESVFVPIQVHIQDSSVSPLEMTAPCLLFNTDVTPKELRVVSERYYPVTLSISDPAKKRIFYVKRKSAHLSYLQDPHSQRSLLVRTGSFQGYTSLDLIASFTDDRKILAFARHFCNVGKSDTPEPFSVSGFCSRVLHECLLLDSEEALPLYLALRSAISSVQAGIRSGVSHVWDFRLIRSYYEQRRRLIPDESPKLLNSEIIAYLSELLQNSIIGLDGKSKINEFGEPVLQDGSISVYFDMPLGGGSDEISEIMDLS